MGKIACGAMVRGTGVCGVGLAVGVCHVSDLICIGTTPSSPFGGEASEAWLQASNRSGESISANEGLSESPAQSPPIPR